MILTSFIFFLVVFIIIGISSTRYHQQTTEDYLLAGKNIKPWLVGLSFFATENSGFMFVGFIGIAYLQGLSAVWILIGWYIGEVFILAWTAKKIRIRTDEISAHTYSALLSRWSGVEFKKVRRLSAVIVMVFLGVYGAAQLSAGSKALHVLMGWNYNTGTIIGFAIVVLYCAAGGLRASIWTDAAQAIVMFCSLTVLAAVGLQHIGGFEGLFEVLEGADPILVGIFPAKAKFGFVPFFIGWLFAGIGVLGQAHVMIRFMVVDSPKNVSRALMYYLGMVITLAALCLTVGLLCRAMLPELINADPELGLPMLSKLLLPDILTGLVLAGLFGAAISTADSQILSSSAAFSRDLFPRAGSSYWWAKFGTILIGSIALLIAISGFNDVFALVVFAWSIMASGFAPLLFLQAVGKRPTEKQALWMIIVGIGASVLWRYLGYADHVYNVLPGILAGLLIYMVLNLIAGGRAEN